MHEDASERLDIREEARSSGPHPTSPIDEITRLAAWVCDTRIALVTMIHESGHRLESATGLSSPLEWLEAPFSAYTVQQSGVLVIPDAATDQRFSSARLVAEIPHVRFYAGAPLLDADGQPIGALSVMDSVARSLTREQQTALQILGRQVVAQLELRRHRLAEEQTEAKPGARHGAEDSAALKGSAAFADRLDAECQRAVRYNRPLSLLLLSANFFPGSVDQPADNLLDSIAHWLAASARSSDVVGCLKTDEFGVLLTDTDHAGALVLGERFRQIVAWAGWEHGPVLVHVGIVSLTAGGDAATLLVDARRALRRSQERESDAMSPTLNAK